MKIFISADIEGIGGVVRGEQSSRDSADYAHARKLMTAEVNSAIQGAFDGGATEVVVTDAHSIGLNLISDEVDERARLILGTPRRLGMMEGVDLGFDAAFFIGYHAAAGTAQAIIAHSYRRRVAEIRLNGRKVGEIGFNAALAGHFNVPVVLISGDEAVCAEARAMVPDILAAPVKKGLGAYSALCLHPKQAQALIHQSAKQALSSTEREPCRPSAGRPSWRCDSPRPRPSTAACACRALNSGMERPCGTRPGMFWTLFRSSTSWPTWPNWYPISD